MNLADLLNKLAKTAGIKEDNEDFKTLVQIKELATTDVPDDLGVLFDKALDTELLSLESAKNNEPLKNHFFALFAGGIDSAIDKVITELDIDEETQTLLKNVDSSFKKISLLPTRLKSKYEAELIEAKKGKGTNEDAEKLNIQIKGLNEELSGLKDTTVAKDLYDQTITDHASKVKDMNVKNLISGRKLTSTLPRNVVIPAAMQVFTDELKAKGITLDDDLNLKSKDGSQDYYINNQPVKIDDFIDTLLAENKLLEVSPETGGNQPTPAPNGAPSPTSGTTVFDTLAAEAEQTFQPQT